MNRRERAICERLVKHGEKIFKAGAEAYPIKFKKPQDLDETQYHAAKNLVHDLEHNSHAFVIGCIVDRQIKADRAWVLPYLLSQRIGSPGEPRFDFCTLLELSEDEILAHMEGPPSLHRFTQKMSQYIHAALHHIADKYEGSAENIWSGCPSSASLVYRFLEFKGIGPKIATMAANALVCHFKILVSDHFSIDISPDRHVLRVFKRLGLVPPEPSPEQVIYRARELNPKFPGLLDFPAFEIGRNWCRPKKPHCTECFMEDICPTARLTT